MVPLAPKDEILLRMTHPPRQELVELAVWEAVLERCLVSQQVAWIGNTCCLIKVAKVLSQERDWNVKPDSKGLAWSAELYPP